MSIFKYNKAGEVKLGKQKTEQIIGDAIDNIVLSSFNSSDQLYDIIIKPKPYFRSSIIFKF